MSSTYPTYIVLICLFFPECPYTPFFRYGTTIPVPYYVPNTYLCRLQYTFVRSHTHPFSSEYRHLSTCPTLQGKDPPWNFWLPPYGFFQYQPTRAPSTKWIDTAPALHHSFLIQRDDQHHWVPRTMAVVYTIYSPHPMIHTSHDTSHTPAPPLQICVTTRVYPNDPSICLSTQSLFSCPITSPSLLPRFRYTGNPTVPHRDS